MNIPDQSIQMQFRSVKRRFKGRYRRAVGPVEVTSLLTVIILVGMFYFSISSFVLQPGVRVHLPESPFLDGAPYGTRVLTLSQEGMVFYNDELTSLEGLGTMLERTDDFSVLLIEADEATTYGTLMDVYGLAIQAGIREVVLATRPPAVPLP
ncbi:MAG: biopolymer transporter ExbD [Verrucomicrobiota bacterium]|nr:biopolymer transporter ExbD [Verrucomicrobiota bacterium]